MTKDNSTGKPKDFYNRGQQMLDRLNLPDDDDDDTQVYAKPWVGLTDDEIRGLYGKDLKYRDGDYMRYAKAIETKLKEKNNG